MRAITLHRFGPASHLCEEETPAPEPGPGQVRIAVEAAGVHLIDTTMRAGIPTPAYPLPELPAVPGREVAGVVDAVGPDTPARWLGRRVVAHLGAAGGGYAEAVVTGAGSLHEVPDGVSGEVAVAMVGTGRTTMGVLETARIGPDDTVLVLAAAGGIGGLLVQAARRVGAFTVGAAGGADKTGTVRALGADAAVDYLRPRWTDEVRDALAGRPLTLVLEGVGGSLGREAVAMLRPGGRAVTYGWASGGPALADGEAPPEGVTVESAVGPRLFNRPGGVRPLAERALAAAAEGWLVPGVHRFPLARAADAHTALTGRATTGKVVLVPERAG